MSSSYSVDPGECFASIAQKKGFFNYRTLYDHGDNAALKAKRPNPNQLVENDVVQIPDKRPKAVNLTLDGTKKFVLDRRKTKLRIQLVDYQKKPLAPARCEATVGSVKFLSTSLTGGMVEMEIDPEETSGELVLFFLPLPPLGSPPKDPAYKSPPGNPPLIFPSDFKDEVPKAVTDGLVVTWDLKIGYLEPKEAVRGTLQRLNNLTFPTPTGTDENDKTAPYVKGYQALKKAANKTGKVSDIRDDLAAFHDNQ